MLPIAGPGAWSTWPAWRTRLLRSTLVWVVLALLVWLDRHALAGAQRAEMFGWLVDAFIWIWRAYTAVEAFIEAHLVAVVTWLWDAVRWLSSHVADFLASTGGMFARVWESAKQFYESVLRPALVWLYDFYTKVRDWLAKVFKPVFEFLRDVRDVIKDIYKRFISPILTIIDVTRAGLRVLGDLGVEWARKLDAKLGEIEGIIQRNFVMVLGRVNQVIDILDSVVNVDRLFQRLPFIRTLDRDAGYWLRLFWNKQIVARKPGPDGTTRPDKLHRRRPAEDAAALEQFWTTDDGPMAPAAHDLSAKFLIAMGVTLDPDTGDLV